MNIVYNMLNSENVLKICKLVILDECRVKKTCLQQVNV